MQDAYLYKTRVGQGKGIAQAAAQPVTSLVRQEDLSFCASRLLMSSRIVTADDSVLGELIESTLSDLAAIQPEDALKRVKNARGAYPEEPIYWALCCHVLAQILSEYSRETNAQTILELRGSLADWFGRFQDSFRAHKQPYKDLELLALMVYFAQTAIFHDKGAYGWARQTMLYNVVEQPFCTETALELAAIVGGTLDPQNDQAPWRQLILHLENVDKVPPNAALVRQAIGGPSADSFSFSREKSNPSVSHHSRELKRDTTLVDEEKSKFTLFMESFLDKFGMFLPYTGVLLLGGLCLWGSGMFLDKVFNTSPVGEKTLSEAYEQMRQQNEERLKNESSEGEKGETSEEIPESTPEEDQSKTPIEVAVVVTPIPTPEPTPIPTPAPTPIPLSSPYSPEDSGSTGLMGPELTTLITQKLIELPPRLKLARMGETGHYKYARLSGNPMVFINPTDPNQAIVYFPINWFERGKPARAQFLEAQMLKTLEGWKVTTTARCTELLPKGPTRVLDEAEIAWSQTLFMENPFYRNH